MRAKQPLYHTSGHGHYAEIGGQKIWVDSNLEERVLRQLEEAGFSERWRRLNRGISYRGARYTPDVELAIERENGTHRALVEIKPSVAHFRNDPTLLGRMHGITGHYGTEFFLLYVDNEEAWYRIETTTGELAPFTDLTPGKLPIHKLHEPFHLPTWRVYDHHYSARPEIMRNILLKSGKSLADFLETFTLALIQPPKKRRRRRRNYKR